MKKTPSVIWAVPVLGLILFPALEGWGAVMLPSLLVAAGAWLLLRYRDGRVRG